MPSRSDIFTSDKLGKILSPAQKIVIFGSLFAAILVFIYSFIYMTPFSDLYQIDGPFLYQKMARLHITKEMIDSLKLPIEAYYFSPFSGENVGLNLAYFTSFTRTTLQSVNHWLFNLGFFGLIASIFPLIYLSQKRRVYYKTNLVVVPAVAAFNLYIGIHMLIQLISTQMLVLSKSNEYYLINAYQTYLNNSEATVVHEYFHTSDGNSIFIIGYIIAIAVIIFALASATLTFLKYKYQKKQKQVDLSKVVINE